MHERGRKVSYILTCLQTFLSIYTTTLVMKNTRTKKTYGKSPKPHWHMSNEVEHNEANNALLHEFAHELTVLEGYQRSRITLLLILLEHPCDLFSCCRWHGIDQVCKGNSIMHCCHGTYAFENREMKSVIIKLSTWLVVAVREKAEMLERMKLTMASSRVQLVTG